MLEKYRAYLNIILKRLAKGSVRVIAAGMVVAVIITGSSFISKQNLTEETGISDTLGTEFAGRNLLESNSVYFADSEAVSEADDMFDYISDDFDVEDSIVLFSLSEWSDTWNSSTVEPCDYEIPEKVPEDDTETEVKFMAFTGKVQLLSYALENDEILDVQEQKRQEARQKAMDEAVIRGREEAEARRAEKERKAEEERIAAEKAAAEAAEKKKTTGIKRLKADEDEEYDLSDSLTYKYNKKMDIEITDEEYEVLCRIVEAEAGDQDVFGRILVANVILNRVRYKKEFADNIIDVVFEKNQFAPTRDGSYYSVTVDDLTKEAVNRATSGEDYSQGALYFFMRSATSASKASWFDSLHFLFKYGCHEFFK